MLARTSSYATLLLVAFFLFSACDSGGAEPNTPPSTTFTFSPSSPRAGTPVNFTANATDSDGEITSYSWDFNADGVQDASGPNPTHTFERQGDFAVRLTVTDDRDGEAGATQTVNVQQRFTQVTITEVEVQSAPFTTSSGQGWDATTGPDLYYAIFDVNAGTQDGGSTIYYNAGPGSLPILFDGSDVTIADFSRPFSIELYDYDDFSNDDFMSGIRFVINDLEIIGDYPSTTVLEVNNTRLRLSLQWKQ